MYVCTYNFPEKNIILKYLWKAKEVLLFFPSHLPFYFLNAVY